MLEAVFLFPDMLIYLCSNILVQLLSNYIYNLFCLHSVDRGVYSVI